MAFDVGTAIGYLDLDTSGFKKGFKSALDDLNTFNTSAKGASEKLTSLGSAFTSAGSSMTKYVTTPLLGIGTAAVVVGNQFESAMSRVGAISGATGDQLEALTNQALDLGSTTAFSASEAAAGMENLASAGFTVEEIMDAMPGLLDLAASSGADLATASEIAASAIRGFGLEADSARHVADVFAEAAARTNAQTEDMGEAMKYIAPVANAMGQSLEETAAAIGIMSDAGIKGSQAGTALRGALSRLAKPTDVMTLTMEELGLSFYDAQGNMLPLNGIIAELEEGMAGLTQEQRNNALITLFGQESLSGMLALMERGSGDLIELTESFEDADGAAAAMAETMLDNTSGSLEEMMGAIETLMINIQQVLAPVITKVANGISKLINKFNELDDGTQKSIVTFAGVVAAIGPVMVVIGKLLTTLGTLPNTIKAAKAGFAVLKGAITGISAPVIAVVAVIGTLVAAFKTLWDNNEAFREQITAIWNEITGVFSDFFNQITEKINSLGFNFENFSEVLKAAWQGLCDFLAPIFIGTFQFISDTLGDILDVILGVVDFFIAVFKGDWDGAWQSISDVFSTAWDWIVSTLGIVGELLLGVLKDLCGLLKSVWEDVWSAVKNFFVDTWNGIIDALQSAWDWIVNLFNGVADWIYARVIKPVGDFFANMWNGLKNGAKSAWEGVKSIFSGVANFFKDIFKNAWEGVKNVFSVGGKIFDGIKDGIVTAFTAVVNTIIKGINKVVSLPFNGLNKILNKIQKIEILGVEPFGWLTWRAPIPELPLISGSYASGLDYVPRDMLVKVHQGESIRTKQQTREDFATKSAPESPRQPLNVTLTLDGRVVGQVAISNINDITDTNGIVPLKI